MKSLWRAGPSLWGRADAKEAAPSSQREPDFNKLIHLDRGRSCCYIIRALSSQMTYVGITNNFNRRLRQHCGYEPGGAFATTSTKDVFVPICIVTGFPIENIASNFEEAMHARMKKARHTHASVVTPQTTISLLLDMVGLQKWSPSSIDASNIPITLNWFSLEYFSDAHKNSLVLPSYVKSVFAGVE